jgi:hypothetical protein
MHMRGKDMGAERAIMGARTSSSSCPAQPGATSFLCSLSAPPLHASPCLSQVYSVSKERRPSLPFIAFKYAFDFIQARALRMGPDGAG